MANDPIQNLGATKRTYFDYDEVLGGLHEAMDFGAMVNPADRVTFYLRKPLDPDIVVDDQGVPLNPTDRATPDYTPIQVQCAYESAASTDQPERMTALQPGELEVTILGPEFDQVVGFEYLVLAGVKYDYRKTLEPVALGNIDVFTVIVQAGDLT